MINQALTVSQRSKTREKASRSVLDNTLRRLRGVRVRR